MADEGLEAQRDLLLHEMEQMEQQSLLHGKPTATPLPRGGGSVVHLARPTFNVILVVALLFNSFLFLCAQDIFNVWGAKAELLEGNPGLRSQLSMLSGMKLDNMGLEMTLMQTVQYLWSNQMQLFASIFFFFSFLMPQVKLLLSGALWFHPSMWDDRRVQAMVALASAGRWNHYDVILGVFLLCVGDLNLMSYKSTSIYSVLHIHAYTREGTYMYCWAVLVSQVIGHVLVHEARRAKRLRLEANGLVITPLKNIPNKTYSVREEVRAIYGPKWEVLMPLLQLANIVVFLCAVCLPAYRVHSLAFGLAEEKVTYTLLGTTLEVMHAATGANDRMGMALVGTMVLSFVLFFPLIRLATQAMLWVGVFTREQHVRLEALHEVAMMWSALDVSLLAGLLVMSEIKHLSMGMFKCPQVNMVNLNNDSDAADGCFFIDITACSGYYVAMVSIVLSYVMNALVQHMVEASKQRLRRASVWQPIVTRN